MTEVSSPQKISNAATEIAEVIKGNKKLREDVSTLEGQKSTLLDSSSSKVASDDSISKEITQLKILAGESDVSGPGVEIKFDKSLQITQLVDLVNALRNIGAEAIVINDVRVVGHTPLYEYMGTAPVTIKAIGSKKILSDSLLRRGGIIEQIDASGKVTQNDSLTLPKVKDR